MTTAIVEKTNRVSVINVCFQMKQEIILGHNCVCASVWCGCVCLCWLKLFLNDYIVLAYLV